MRLGRQGQIALWIILLGGILGWSAQAQGSRPKNMERIIGLYIHQHWPYKHPYAARTWTLEDWRGWAEGCKQLGYNTFLIWPLLEVMPDPPTPSDRAYLQRLGKVVEMLHRDFGMRAYLVLCPNIIANHAEASKATFEKRHYYYSDTLVNPGDPVALERLVRWRERLMQPLKEIDGIAIIDSDPGCYPGSTNEEFVNLLHAHRKMLDRLRPGIELIYWMHVGWRGWSRLYETGKYLFGTPEELQDTLNRLHAINPEPWGIANGLPYAEKLGIAHKVISFNYGRIEGEPSFPMTNFGGTIAYEGGKAPTARGVMGNAQTHCVQLPNIFAFARGATGQPLTDADYLTFANDLIPGQGQTILTAWQTLVSGNVAAMQAQAEELESLAADNPAPGKLKGLLFGSPRRFLLDLSKMLRFRAAVETLTATVEKGEPANRALRQVLKTAEIWQKTHGYENYWYDPKLHAALRKLNHPALNAALNTVHEVKEPYDPGIKTPSEQIRANFYKIETHTPLLLNAMRTALRDVK